ncbi:MAG: lipopolysaccharide transport system ATP-binding protein [Acidobacteriota bacterium]|nr:lipopolysaccharide transport system ATP-binding protein [Acidobacteriota bacterium]
MSARELIAVEAVSKKYCRDLEKSLRYGLRDIASALVGRSAAPGALREGEFWALSEVSLALAAGECLGVIGPNGAGKSTLLKLIQGRLHPDRGRIVLRGKLAAISELGIGFNPVLSGRENIFHNAALLGLSRDETLGLLGQIIEFSELEEFIDAPVFTYSSGMRARLGYAVAAHLDPDALLIDEVLTVGDLAFRRKCVQHMQRFLARGKAVLLVSHEMYSVQTLCTRAIYLERGEVVFAGASTEAVNLYLKARRGLAPRPAAPSTGDSPVALAAGVDAGAGAGSTAVEAPASPGADGRLLPRQPSAREPVIITGVAIETLEPGVGGELRSGCRARVIVRYHAHAKRERLFWAFRIATADLLVQVTSGILPAESFPENRLAAGEGMLSCILPRLTLTAGTYAMRVVLAEPEGTLLAMFGFEDAPLYFNVASGASAVDNMHEMSGDLVTLTVESEP